jgi:tetratricopeptide (TPR) repeat protein
MRISTTSLCLALALCTVAIPGVAHDGPEHEIELLTEKMKQGETARLLADRAVEYRLLGKLAEAIKDLERAAALEPDSIMVHRELGRAHFLNGKPKEALATVNRGVNLEADEPGEMASVRMLRAEILRSEKDYRKALEDCDVALGLHKENPEWYLLRSDLQKRLKMPQERLAGLEIGIKETGAGVLEIERVEAQIDAGRFDPALVTIERELRDSRIQSSWLIRRARALLGLGRKAEAEANLKTALEEISTRLNSKTPDAPLLLDKALAHELLSEARPALRAYRDAKDKGAASPLEEKIKALEKTVEAQSAAERAPKP